MSDAESCGQSQADGAKKFSVGVGGGVRQERGVGASGYSAVTTDALSAVEAAAKAAAGLAMASLETKVVDGLVMGTVGRAAGTSITAAEGPA